MMKNKQPFWSNLINLSSQETMIDKIASSSSSVESETNSSSKKRKFISIEETATTKLSKHDSVDLQLKDPLPLDWEQCLDLQSGRMYYQNRRTLRRSLEKPNNDHHHHNHKLDLELNISPFSSSNYSENRSNALKPVMEEPKNMLNFTPKDDSLSTSTSSNNMVALACLNCHLLVIVSKSCPCCPNCKYVHSLANNQQLVHTTSSSSPIERKNTNVKSLQTLSLLI